MALQPALGLGASFFPFKKEIAMATVVRFDELVTNFFNLKEIFKSCLVSGIILQVSMVLGVVSLSLDRVLTPEVRGERENDLC